MPDRYSHWDPPPPVPGLTYLGDRLYIQQLDDTWPKRSRAKVNGTCVLETRSGSATTSSSSSAACTTGRRARGTSSEAARLAPGDPETRLGTSDPSPPTEDAA
jgi:hypothetical protein